MVKAFPEPSQLTLQIVRRCFCGRCCCGAAWARALRQPSSRATGCQGSDRTWCWQVLAEARHAWVALERSIQDTGCPQLCLHMLGLKSLVALIAKCRLQSHVSWMFTVLQQAYELQHMAGRTSYLPSQLSLWSAESLRQTGTASLQQVVANQR